MADTPFFPRPPRLAVYLVVAHFCLSLGGLLMHLRIHPMGESYFHWVPGLVGVVNCIVLPALFLHPRGVGMAYVLNLLTVVSGTVSMAYFSIHHLTPPYGIVKLLMFTTFPYIVILFAKVPLGQIILETMRPGGIPPEGQRGCRPAAAAKDGKHHA